MELSNPDKILFPKAKITKKELLDYYLNVSSRLIPLIKDRPITMQRYPAGIQKQGFIQKNVPKGIPKSLKTVKVSKKASGSMTQLVCNSKEALRFLVNQGCITLHTTLSKALKLNKPDRLIFDLDPSTKNFSKVKQAAFDLKNLLENDLKLKTFIMTTGSKGLHIVVPIKPLLEFEKVRGFAKKVAEVLVSKNPKAYTVETRKASRKGRLFIDYLRNGYSQTAVAPYSVRATPNASVAMPIHWADLKSSNLRSDSFTISNSKKYLSKNSNPWSNICKNAQSLARAIKLIDNMYDSV